MNQIQSFTLSVVFRKPRATRIGQALLAATLVTAVGCATKGRTGALAGSGVG